MPKRSSSKEEQSGGTPSFEESLSELQSIVSDLEEGEIGLEASLARFERGIGLLRVCYSILEAAEAKVEILTRFQEGEALTAPFDAAATFDSIRERATTGPRNTPEEGTSADDPPGKPSLF